MSNQIYIVIVNDRHSDDSVYPYLDMDKALARAEQVTSEMISAYDASPDEIDRELNSAMQRDGWLFYACLEDAGHVRVERRELL